MSRHRKIRKLAFEIADTEGFRILEHSKSVRKRGIAFVDPKEPDKIRFVDEIKNGFHLMALLHEIGHILRNHHKIERPSDEEIKKLVAEKDDQGLEELINNIIEREVEAWLEGFRLFYRFCGDISLSREEVSQCIKALAVYIDSLTVGYLDDETLTIKAKDYFREVFEQLKKEYPGLDISERIFDFELERQPSKRD